ncbi:hypothetical protein CDO52_11065 [Nocardiopsis gilva YIM 90087]|uniref:Bacterial spore germination immunoglobulin-like domain-containing protein n=1 Tax=Nocardiopsis gilva YIM 90087 TaxID=1235441 RepID=A0A223S545_9ACTN|nr:hypothetical protein [Nocardiopsis gilva]ASU83244.1 hypothetical protein CDO52_11065 [Nocardiopsis gilva YIM 90087]
MKRLLLLLLLLPLTLLTVGCATGERAPNSDTDARETGDSTANDAGRADAQHYPDVVKVDVSGEAGTYDFTVTISSPYDTPERYADGWRVTGPDGTVYGEHELAHDHQNEQPFTRTQRNVGIPTGVDEVTIEGRDSENGYGGGTQTVRLPR